MKDSRYLDTFVRRSQRGADMLLLGLFPNAKEITESMGALNALSTYVPGAKRSRYDFTVVVVGDGNTPRTAGLCAFYSAWQCVSIDPRMKAPLRWSKRIDRLVVHKCRVEDLTLALEGDGAILAVHSHASIRASLDHVTFTGQRSLILMPCCNHEMPVDPPHHSFSDPCVWSPSRTIHVWQTI